jgi:hypothetical protein
MVETRGHARAGTDDNAPGVQAFPRGRAADTASFGLLLDTVLYVVTATASAVRVKDT